MIWYTEVLWFFVCVYHWLVVLGLKTSDINYIYGFILGFMMNKDVGNFCLTFIVHGYALQSFSLCQKLLYELNLCMIY